MIETFFGRDALGTPAAFLAALVIGLAFGFALERAGFGSSRKLAGIFYLPDMTVLKVMFTAVITAMLGLGFIVGLGWVDLPGQINLLETRYAAQVLGGLVFGVGFVLGGWCPGTAAVGAASGKLDAFVFLGGTVLGAIGFNETYGLWQSVVQWGAYEEPQFAFGFSKAAFGFLFTLAAIGAFHFAEWIERPAGGGKYLGTPFLKAFSLALLVFAVALFLLPGTPPPDQSWIATGLPAGDVEAEQILLADIDAAADHIEPEELADRLLRGEPDLIVVDVRPPAEYAAFHIPGAVNRPFQEDLDDSEQLKPAAELAAAYAVLIPSKETPVVVHFRTGHQASQTFFVLTRLLGYKDVKWYDASWTEWAARPELPVEK